jgi:dephospho-CoA kinase
VPLLGNAESPMQKNRDDKTVLVIVGMPGAGKSLASSVLKQRGVNVFVSGDIVRAEARKLRLKFTRKNLGELMLKLRREEGMAAVAKRLIPLVIESPGTTVVYEGARSIEEVEELRRNFHVVTLAIHASEKARFQRLQRRRRSDRPRGWKDFVERDNRELSVGLAKLIALADRTVENEDTKEDLRRRMKRLLKTILSTKRS